jgi:cardiolipin synthase (CMP-forming)
MKKFSFSLLHALPAHEKKITFSTLLTLLRIVLVPCIVVTMVYHAWQLAFWLFIAAAITDVLDGLFARWFNDQTFLGAVLDPIADKLLILSVFFTLAFVQSPLFTIPLWFVILVLIKEIIQLCGVIVLYICNGHIAIAPTMLGKTTMAAQTLFITWLFSCYFFHWVPVRTYYAMLTGLLSLIFFTLLHYIRIGYAQVRSNV